MKSDYVKSELISLKNTLVDYLLIVISILGLPAIFIAILSLKNVDVFPLFSIIGYSLIVLILIFSKKIPYQIKTGIILLIGYILGTKALMNQGLVSDGFFYYIIIGVVSSVLLGTTIGIVLMLLSILTAGLIAYLYFNGVLVYTFDIISFANLPSSWISFIMITLLFTSVVILLSSKINSYLLGVINSLSARSLSLDSTNQKLAEEIENRKSFETTLKNTAKIFKSIFNSINDAIIIFDEDNNIIEANRAFYDFTGYKREQITFLNLKDLFDEYDKIKTSIFSGNNDIFSFYRNEINLKTQLGENTIPVEITLMPFPDEKSGNNVIILRDITKSKESERQILHAIVQAEEKERTRVSQDLHDSLGPLLSAIKLYSNSIVDATTAVKRNDIHSRITELMDEAIKTVKEISNNLSSHVLKSFGLYEAIDLFAEKIQSTYPIKIISDFDKEIKTSDALQITLYRVLVELINNTLKYAYATEIKIKMRLVNNRLIFIYQDNGKGFDVEQVIKDGKGMGLYNMHSRIKSLGGTILVQSSPEGGVIVEIQI